MIFHRLNDDFLCKSLLSDFKIDEADSEGLTGLLLAIHYGRQEMAQVTNKLCLVQIYLRSDVPSFQKKMCFPFLNGS